MVVMLYTISETARSLGVGRTTVYNLIKQGRLEKVKLNNSTRVTVSSIVELTKSREGAK